MAAAIDLQSKEAGGLTVAASGDSCGPVQPVKGEDSVGRNYYVISFSEFALETDGALFRGTIEEKNSLVENLLISHDGTDPIYGDIQNFYILCY